MFEDEPKFKTKTEWTNEARKSEFNMSSNQIQNKQKLLTKNQNKAKRHRPNPDPPAHGQGRRGRRPGPPWKRVQVCNASFLRFSFQFGQKILMKNQTEAKHR